MRGTAHKLIFFALVGAMVSLAYGINYMYFSHFETTVFGDRIRFWGQDSLAGPIRTNTQFAIMQNPVFYDYVIQSAGDFEHGPGYSPVFQFEPGIMFNAPELPLPADAMRIRQRAFQEGYYYNAGPDMQAWVRIRHDTLRVTWAEVGEPFDSLTHEEILLPDSANVFFDASVRISGVVSTVLILGASGRVGLEDDIRYVNTSGPPEYRPLPGHTEKFALVSENEIKILNTPANGRENSNFMGSNQPNQDLTSIVLHGIYVALNESFTFEQQNDGDSGYVCTPCGCVPGPPGQNPPACGTGGPDERGTIWLSGSLMQMRRGYVHRSCCNGTGYDKQYRYDNDLRYWDIHLWDPNLRENVVEPLTLNFGAVMVGDTAWDTVRVYNDFIPVWLSNIASDFIVPVDSDSVNWVHRIPVGFAPHMPGDLTGMLMFDIPYYDRSVMVPLSGIGIANTAGDVPPSPREWSLSVYPNPFNSSAVIRFSIPEVAQVSVILYDIQGREIAALLNDRVSAGEHTVSLDGAALSTGLYFARLATPSRQMTAKVLLIK